MDHAHADPITPRDGDTSTDPTGIQFHLVHEGRLGRVTAHVAQVGAALRGLSVGGVDLVPPYPLGTATPAASGVVLVPWPNRVRDGVWTQRGATHSLAVTEVATNTAAHGLLRRAPYDAASATPSSIELTAPIAPTPGYPFALRTSVRYALTDDGLEVTHTIENVGTDAAPVALGTHPYLLIGGVPTSDLVLRSPASTRFVVDDRRIPVDEVPVVGDSDLRSGRRVGDLHLDTGFGGLTRDPDGRVRHSLTAPDGRSVTLWAGPGFDYVQLFTTDRYPGQEVAVAIEPMTAPADALNSGSGLRWIGSGEAWNASWGISYTLSS